MQYSMFQYFISQIEYIDVSIHLKSRLFRIFRDHNYRFIELVLEILDFPPIHFVFKELQP